MTEIENSKLKSKVSDLRHDIESHQNTLNFEAIWLFIATLACWSVDTNAGPLRLFAVGLVFTFFLERVFENKKNQKSFGKRAEEIRDEIKEFELEDDAKKARTLDLQNLEKERLGVKSIYKSTPRFLMAYSFWAISIAYFIGGFFYWITEFGRN